MKKKRTAIRFGKQGLLPAIIQDRASGRVLMLAHMNRRALKETLESGRSVFWSRSRQELWRKGETSGHVQKVRSVSTDCDQDALLLQVDSAGPACHTGRTSCFFDHLKGRPAVSGGKQRKGSGTVLAELDAVIRSRKGASPEHSYTARLFTAGLDRILRKIGEESTEVVVAAKNPDPQHLAQEAADLVYHLLVLLAERGIGLADVAEVLQERRRGEKT